MSNFNVKTSFEGSEFVIRIDLSEEALLNAKPPGKKLDKEGNVVGERKNYLIASASDSVAEYEGLRFGVNVYMKPDAYRREFQKGTNISAVTENSKDQEIANLNQRIDDIQAMFQQLMATLQGK